MPSETRAFDIRSALKEAMARLRTDGVPSHTLAAELLLMHVLGRDRAWLYAHPEESIEPANSERYFELVARRAAGTPTQYLTGKQEFWGLEFHVEPGVLIPRPETEHLIEVALERLGPIGWPSDRVNSGPRGTGLRVVDVGTGSGCIAVALARELPGAEIFATDISQDALRIAKQNAEKHRARIQFHQGNLLEPFLPKSRIPNLEFPLFHLVVSNPPYVARQEEPNLPREVREHEPEQALFGGPRGPEIYEPLIWQAEQLLAPGGNVVLELGHDSLAVVRKLLDETHGWTQVGVTNDLAGIPRVLAARRM